jgi:hypothetical protein
MVKCCNCDKPAIYAVGPEGEQLPFCLDCNLKHVQMLAIQNDQLERSLNYATEQMEAIVGISGILPRFPQRQVRVIEGGTVTLNNIHVSNSNIGILNTGNLEIIDSAITQLNQDSGAQEISGALSKLATAIAASDELSVEKQNEAMQLLSVIATEATAPKQKRRGVIVKPLLASLATIIQTSASLIQIWQSVEPTISTFFN